MAISVVPVMGLLKMKRMVTSDTVSIISANTRTIEKYINHRLTVRIVFMFPPLYLKINAKLPYSEYLLVFFQ